MALRLVSLRMGDARALHARLDEPLSCTATEFRTFVAAAMPFCGPEELDRLAVMLPVHADKADIAPLHQAISDARTRLRGETDRYAPIPRDVFLVHARANRDAARCVANALAAAGLSVWSPDENLEPGADEERALLRAAGRARIMIALRSESAALDKTVSRALAAGVEMRLETLALPLDNAPPNALFRALFDERNTVADIDLLVARACAALCIRPATKETGCAYTVCVAEAPPADFRFAVVRGAAVLMRYLGTSSAVRIPAAFRDFAVTSVADKAFRDCAALEEVALPEGVTAMGVGAFMNCRALRAVRLPASLAKIGPGAFQGCVALEEIILPPRITEIPAFAFSGCASLGNVVLPEGILKIGPRAFERCACLGALAIPRKAIVSADAFEGCVYGTGMQA
jgi:hypothetical protein